MTAPLVPPEVDLRGFPYMPLDVARLRDSDLAALTTGDEFRAFLLLTCASWHQLPAGSLPDDDAVLSRLAGYGRVVREWMAVRKGATRGWLKCDDGRLYHPVVAEKANEAWGQKLGFVWRKECDRLRKENVARKQRGLPALEMPKGPTPGQKHAAASPAASHSGSDGIPAETHPPSDGIPVESPPVSDGIPAETALKGTERNGTEQIDRSSPRSQRASEAETPVHDLAETYRALVEQRAPDRPSGPNSRPAMAELDALFDRFWGPWPHKVARSAALKAFARVAPEIEAILAGMARYVREKPPDRQWMNPATFLNGRRWEDAPAQVSARAGAPPSGSRPQTGGDYLAKMSRECDQEMEFGHVVNPPGADRFNGPTLELSAQGAPRDDLEISQRGRTDPLGQICTLEFGGPERA